MHSRSVEGEVQDHSRQEELLLSHPDVNPEQPRVL